MNVLRFPVNAAAAFVLALTACSQTDDLTTPPTLKPQFGTSGYDEVTDIAYGKALTLYAIGVLERNAFVRRYSRSGALSWESYFDVEPAYTNEDYQNGGYLRNMTAHAVAVDNAGNAVVAWSADYSGYFYDEVYNDYVFDVVASFNYLTKYSPSGTKLWRVYTDHPLTDLALDSNANIYATSGAPFADSGTALLKYTSGGSLAWTRSQSVSPTGVTVSGSNSVYIVREDGAVAKYNASGTRLWLKTRQLDGYNWSGGFWESEPYKVAAGLADELYITATHYNDSSYACDAGLIQDFYTMRVYKLNSTGVRQWFRNVASGSFTEGVDCGGDEYNSVSGLGVDTDTKGSIYIAGYQNGNGQDGFIAKYSRAGAQTWEKTFVTFKDDAATSVASYDGSEVFIGGVTEGNLAHSQLGGGGDAVLRKVNSNGERIWTR